MPLNSLAQPDRYVLYTSIALICFAIIVFVLLYDKYKLQQKAKDLDKTISVQRTLLSNADELIKYFTGKKIEEEG